MGAQGVAATVARDADGELVVGVDVFGAAEGQSQAVYRIDAAERIASYAFAFWRRASFQSARWGSLQFSTAACKPSRREQTPTYW